MEATLFTYVSTLQDWVRYRVRGDKQKAFDA